MSRIIFPGVEQLLEQAESACGWSDFGVGFEGGLTALVAAIRADVDVNKDNLPLLAGPILQLLVSRAYSQQGWKDRPDCLRQTIRAPLVVTGIPRTGTTALHKLLSMDAQFQGLEQWLIGTPMPRPPQHSWNDNPLFRAAVSQQQAFLEAVPALRIAHEVNADEVDECLNLLAQSFVSHYPATGIGLPHYDSWWWGRDERASYQRYADNLRLIGADAADQRWLLKNPGHIAHLDSLLEVFPDAMIIQTHRDPATCIASLCGVIWPARCFFHARQMPANAVGPRELELWAWSVERAEKVRKSRPQQFFDVDFGDFNRQPMVVVRAIYQHFGLDLQAQTEQAMQQWLAANIRHKHGRHEYSPEQYGLSQQLIHQRFAGYMAKYGLKN